MIVIVTIDNQMFLKNDWNANCNILAMDSKNIFLACPERSPTY